MNILLIVLGTAALLTGAYWLFLRRPLKYLIPESALSIIPYTGEETLEFVSATGEVQILSLQGTQRRMVEARTGIRNVAVDHLYLYYRHPDPIPPHHYITGMLLELSVDKKRTPLLKMGLSAKNAKYYAHDWYTREELNQMPRITLSMNDIQHPDVVVLEDRRAAYSQRYDHIERLYWSPTRGIVGFEKQNHERWILRNTTISTKPTTADASQNETKEGNPIRESAK